MIPSMNLQGTHLALLEWVCILPPHDIYDIVHSSLSSLLSLVSCLFSMRTIAFANLHPLYRPMR